MDYPEIAEMDRLKHYARDKCDQIVEQKVAEIFKSYTQN